jgi:hypothetical protein
MGAPVPPHLRRKPPQGRGIRTANTERALLGDVLLFTAWCTDAGLRHLPASAETVAAFIITSQRFATPDIYAASAATSAIRGIITQFKRQLP